MSKLVSSSATPVDVSVVIVSFNTREPLRECIQTLERETSEATYETIVVDNASADGSADMVEKEFPGVQLVRSATNLGFAAANNRGFGLARGRYVSQLNSDAFVNPGAQLDSSRCSSSHLATASSWSGKARTEDRIVRG